MAARLIRRLPATQVEVLENRIVELSHELRVEKGYAEICGRQADRMETLAAKYLGRLEAVTRRLKRLAPNLCDKCLETPCVCRMLE